MQDLIFAINNNDLKSIKNIENIKSLLNTEFKHKICYGKVVDQKENLLSELTETIKTTPLLYSLYIKNINTNIIKFFIENGADVNYRNNNGDNTALLIASNSKFVNTNKNIIKLLIKNGADVNVVSKTQHFTSLMHLMTNNNNNNSSNEAIKFLINNNSSVKNRNQKLC